VSFFVLVAGPFSSLVALDLRVDRAHLERVPACVAGDPPDGGALRRVRDRPPDSRAPDAALTNWIAITMLICVNAVVIGWVAGPAARGRVGGR